MFEHYVELLKSTNRVYNGPAGYSYLKDGVLTLSGMENVTQVEFRYFYQSLLYKLFRMGELDIKSDRFLMEYMSDVESFLENADRIMKQDYDLYNDQKIYSQRFYGELLRKSPSQIKNLTNLVYLIFDDIVKNNKGIIEIDTNVIYYTGELDLSWMPIRFNSEVIKYFFPLAKKRSIIIDSKNNIKIRGSIESTEREIIMPFIMSKVRESKIDDIIRDF